MAANIPDYVPWHIYERDIQRLSDDIGSLVSKIDGLVEVIGGITLSQHRDDVMEDHRREHSLRRWSLGLAAFAASLSCVSAIIVAWVSSTL
jgi:hypothetical protein